MVKTMTGRFYFFDSNGVFNSAGLTQWLNFAASRLCEITELFVSLRSKHKFTFRRMGDRSIVQQQESNNNLSPINSRSSNSSQSSNNNMSVNNSLKANNKHSTTTSDSTTVSHSTTVCHTSNNSMLSNNSHTTIACHPTIGSYLTTF